MFLFFKIAVMGQAVIAPFDLHFFAGEELDCEYFLDCNPYEFDEQLEADLFLECECQDDEEVTL